jgi:amino acid adenylation domain-containing protein
MKPYISGRKRELLSALVRKSGLVRDSEDRDFPKLTPMANHPAELPLSYGQQRLWLTQQIDPGGVVHNRVAAFRLKGKLNLEALQSAFQEIIRRHATLRTSFHNYGGSPVQQILAERPFAIEVKDATGGQHLPEEVAKQIFCRPFSLDKDMLIRVTVLRIDEFEYGLIIAAHHIVCDGWSLGVFVRELEVLYPSSQENWHALLKPLPIQYADYVLWQRGAAMGKIFDKQVQYWKQRLADFPPQLGRVDVVKDSHRGSAQVVSFRSETTQHLQAICDQNNVTMFMLLLAATAVVLQRCIGQSDLMLGTTVAGRLSPELEPLIGFFANLLPLRIQLFPELTFRQFLAGVREICVEAYSNQELPFDRLVQELNPPRVQDGNPIVHALFSYRNTKQMELKLPGMTVEAINVPGDTLEHELSVTFDDFDGRLNGILEFRPRLFRNESAMHLARSFESFLALVPRILDERLCTMEFVEEEHRSQALGRNDHADIPDPAVHEMIALRAKLSPQRAAIIYRDRTLSYERLDYESNQLASYLRRQGVGAEHVVGIYLDRSPEIIIAALAVLKAGAGYLPLDTSYPKKRLEAILADSGVRLVISQEHLEKQGAIENIRFLCLDDDEERRKIGLESGTMLDTKVHPDHIAYVLYTSGSTGKPKGVIVQHGSLSNLLISMQAEPGFREGETLLALTTLSFDISNLEIFLPLICGGTVILETRETARDGIVLKQKLAQLSPNVMQATPSTWHMLMDVEWQPERGLRIFAGGEVLEPAIARHLVKTRGEVWNLYGPTETTIWSTLCRVQAQHCSGDVTSNGGEAARSIPIGGPIRNTQCYIVDEWLRLLPKGVAGELCIAGSGLARGYINDAVVTAGRFIPNPFATSPGERMYRTGDFCRQLPTGEIEFLGRKDKQIKLRGFRIELPEIERALDAVPALAQVAVEVKNEVGGMYRIVGYLVLRTGHSKPSIAQLRQELSNRLPDFMIPTQWVWLERFPVMPNGKVDRRALLEMKVDESGSEEQGQPRNDVEEKIAAIWNGLIGANRMGIHDNFFELGGHSLLATKVAARIQSEFNIDFPARFIFTNPTISQTADVIAALLRNPESSHMQIPRASGEDLLRRVETMTEDQLDMHLNHLLRE